MINLSVDKKIKSLSVTPLKPACPLSVVLNTSDTMGQDPTIILISFFLCCAGTPLSKVKIYSGVTKLPNFQL